MSDNYIEKNRGFITSSKIKEFMRCQKCYYYKYVAEIPDPTEQFAEKDHFLIGQALDDLITHGEEHFKANYETVARRTKESDKIQLTNTHTRTINALAKEFKENSMFTQNPKKLALEIDFEGFKLRGELDDFDKDKQLIKDIKTCANITTFNPDFYLIQMSFYQWLVEEKFGIKCDALLEVVDKYTYFSRSRAILYTKQTLEAHRGVILQALEQMKLAHDTGIYASAESQNVLYTCPYYGYEGHGRPTEPLIY